MQHPDIDQHIYTPIYQGNNIVYNYDIFPSILLFVSLILFTIIIFLYRRKLFIAFKAMTNSSGMNILLRESAFINQPISLLMFLLYISSCSLFYYEFLNYHNIEIFGLTDLPLFFLVAFVVILAPLLKLLICLYLTVIFKIKRSMHQILVVSVLYNFMAGVILIPVLFIAMYSKFTFLFDVGLLLLLINYTLCFFRVLAIGLSDKKLSNIYFVIYTCVFMILPTASMIIYIVRGY